MMSQALFAPHISLRSSFFKSSSRACILALCSLFLCSTAFAQDGKADEATTKKKDNVIAVDENPSTDDAKKDDAKETTSTTTTEKDATASKTMEKPAEEKPAGARLTGHNLNLEGSIGFHGLAAAKVGNPMNFRAAFFGEFYTGENTIRQNDSNTRAAGNLFVQATVLEYLAINFGLKASGNSNTYGQPEAMLTQGDANLGVTAVYEVNEFLSVGGDLNLFFPASFGSTGLSLAAVSARPRLLASLDIRPLSDGEVPIDLHLNAGFMIDRSEEAVPTDINDVTRVERFAYRISAYDYFQIGFGAEYDLPYARPFVGFNLGLPVNGPSDICDRDSETFRCATSTGFGSFPKILSLGVRAEPIEHLGLHAGLDLSLTTEDALGVPVTLPYNFVFGVSWTIDPTPKIEIVEKIVEKEKIVDRTPKYGYIVGTVVDSETKEPVRGARIEYLGTAFTPQSSSENNGSFRSYGLQPETEVAMRVTHPDYEPIEVKQVTAVGESPLNVTMTPIPKRADLVGRVLDSKDKPIMLAKVRISGEGQSFNVPVDAAGRFRQEVTPGKYEIAVTSPDHLTKGRSVELKKDDKMSLDFVLPNRPKKTLASLAEDRIEIKQKVFFDKNKATIQKKSFALLDSVSAVIIENPKKAGKIRIEGHTDDSGKKDYNLKLSQERADAVKKYLIEQGVNPSRLDAKGYGDRRPLLPNINRRNRAINRRVEFKILAAPAPAPTPEKKKEESK